jgi:sulfur carrier protein
MRLIVNGAEREVAATTVATALSALAYGEATVATALNGDFVARHRREETPVKEGDKLEIVAPRQGG